MRLCLDLAIRCGFPRWAWSSLTSPRALYSSSDSLPIGYGHAPVRSFCLSLYETVRNRTVNASRAQFILFAFSASRK